MPRIVINKDTLVGGLKSSLAGLASSWEAGLNQYTRLIGSGIDLYRAGFEGHITPSERFDAAGVSNAGITSLPIAVAVDITSATPNIHYLLGGLAGTAPKTVLTQSQSTYTSSAAISAHAGHNFTNLPSTGFWGEDIILYKVGTTMYIFYSWNDNADGDVGRMSVTAGSPNDAFMTTVPAGFSATGFVAAVPHRMVEGADGILYIANGRYVASFDGATGANGTVNYTRYDLGVGWIATDIRKYGNYLAIAAVKSGGSYINYTFSSECRVNLWNMTEPGLGLSYDIPDNLVSAIFPIPNNGLLAFTVGKNNSVKIFEFTGQGFRKIWESIIYTVSPDPKSIELYRDLVCWNTASRILAFDLNTKGVHEPFFVNDGTTDVTTVGFLKNTNQSFLLAGGVFGGTYKTVILYLSSGYSANACSLVTRLYSLPFRSTITKITVFFSQMASGSSTQLSLFKNYVTRSIGTSGVDFLSGFPLATMSFAADGALTEREIPCSITLTSAFYLNIQVIGQISIREIIIEFE